MSAGTGDFRYVQVKPVYGGATLTLNLSDGNSTVTTSTYISVSSEDNQVPIISDIPDQHATYSHPDCAD